MNTEQEIKMPYEFDTSQFNEPAAGVTKEEFTASAAKLGITVLSR